MGSIVDKATDLTDREPAPIRVFLRASDAQTLGGILGRVASWLGLDVYGSSLLRQRAAIDIKSAALVLLVIFFFDLGAWTLLFNTLLHSQLLDLDGWSVLAALGGFLFAAAVLLYERQFFTADVWEGWRGVARPMAARLLVIISAALVTAQPVELLFFKEAISQRAHEEGVRLEVVTRRKEVERINRELENLRAQVAALPSAAQQEIEYGEYRASLRQVSELKAKHQEWREEVQRAEGNRAHWRSEVARRRETLAAARTQLSSSAGSANPEAAKSVKLAEKAHEEALLKEQRSRDRLSSAQTELRGVESQLPVAESQVADAWGSFQARRAQLEASLESKIQAAKQAEDRIERWIRRLRELQPSGSRRIVEHSEPGDEYRRASRATSSALDLGGGDLEDGRADGLPMAAQRTGNLIAPREAAVLPASGRKWEYDFPDYHFFRQLRVLKDLRKGQPPLWEGVSTSEAERLAAQYGLLDVRPCSGNSPIRDAIGEGQPACDEGRWRRHQQEAAIYQWSWLIVYGVAFIIPMLVIAMKLLMSPELRAYYSTTCQARAGNLDAIASQQVIGAAGSESR